MKRIPFLLLTLLIGLSSLPQIATAGRMYDPEISRFMSIDPILNKKMPNELQKLAGGQVYSNSPYNYTFNNPINLVDPDGNLPILPILWAAVEIGMTAYDAYDVYTTVTNQNATSGEIAASVGGALLGLFMPGGGYSGADDAVKAGVRLADNALPAITKTTQNSILKSANEAASSQIQKGARALAKKQGHAKAGNYNSAFDGMKPTQDNALELMQGIFNDVVDIAAGKKTTDIYNSAGQGLRYNTETGEFIGFLEGSLRSR